MQLHREVERIRKIYKYILICTILQMASTKENIPPCHTKGKKVRQWNPEDMAKAIAIVRNKEIGWLKASKEMNVPQRTL